MDKVKGMRHVHFYTYLMHIPKEIKGSGDHNLFNWILKPLPAFTDLSSLLFKLMQES